MHEVIPTLRSSISALKQPNPTVLIVDMFGTPALEVADQFHMLKYVFVSSKVLCLATFVSHVNC